MEKNNNQSYNNQKKEYGNNNYQNQNRDMNYVGRYDNGDYTNQYSVDANSYNNSYSAQNTNYNNIQNNAHSVNKGNNQYNQENFAPDFNYEEYKEPKKKTGILFLISFLVIGLLAITAYFGYTKYVLDKKAVVNLNQYEIDFKAYGTDGDGTASVDIKKIPMVDTDDATVTKFLQEPTITYSKSNNLKNGEKVEVTISLSKTSAEAKKLELKGEFKRSYTVRGLNEKTKDSSRDSSSSTSIVLRENSSINTKELTDSQVGDWARAIYIRDYSKGSVNSDFSYDVWLGSDHLAYANLKRNGSTVGKYRVNASGQLEHYENGGWKVVSSTYTS
ncbi:hypothetical protein [uncultured Gemella sp.]|uniref:hypothetical protein n=1 Tax=uncultured Gemella sp. TaxID=254352 RepID=UPI0025DFBAEA|nr:hypothetical protein [uncultured Gemella sp.]